jgi:ubiquinone/menaquinone biosynthesis C-methylase UbiE
METISSAPAIALLEDIQSEVSRSTEGATSWLSKTAARLTRFYSRMPIWGKVLFWLVVLMIIHLIGPWGSGSRNAIMEGFRGDDGTSGKDFLSKRGLAVYDDFYASLYDDLVYDPRKNNFELMEIRRATKIEPGEAIVLDVGCGTGHHAGALQASGVDVIGVDQSEAMIRRAQKRYPDVEYRVADVTSAMTFPPETFTHIMCLYFTVYYIEDKPTFFQNCYNWLKPGGYLALHLVNRNKFDPIVAAANPLTMVSPQKYAKERITKSVVKFRDAQYRAEFIPHNESNYSEFNETFKNDATGHIRRNEHLLYMPSQRAILQMAQNAGFNLLGKIDMVVSQYEYQYIHILYRPL